MATIRPVNYDELEALVGQLNEQFGGQCRLKLSGDHLMPFLDYGSSAAAAGGDGTIMFSTRTDVLLLLFTAHRYESEQLRRILPLYLMANRHVEVGNWPGAATALEDLDRETLMLAIDYTHSDLPADFTFYLDMQAEAMLLHEYAHYAFRHDPGLLSHISQVITDDFFSDIPSPLSRHIAQLLESDGQAMEELSCDLFAATVLAERLDRTELTADAIEEAIRQVVRMYASLEFLAEVNPLRVQGLKGGVARRAFDTVRPPLVCLRLTSEWEDMSVRPMIEEMKAARTRASAIRSDMKKMPYYRMRKDMPNDVSDEQCEDILSRLAQQEQTILHWYTFNLDDLDEYNAWRDFSAYSKALNLLGSLPESDKNEALNEMFSKLL